MNKCRVEQETNDHLDALDKSTAEYEANFGQRLDDLVDDYNRPGVMSKQAVQLHNFIIDLAGDDLTFSGELSTILSHSLKDNEAAGIVLADYVRGLAKKYLEQQDG